MLLAMLATRLAISPTFARRVTLRVVTKPSNSLNCTTKMGVNAIFVVAPTIAQDTTPWRAMLVRMVLNLAVVAVAAAMVVAAAAGHTRLLHPIILLELVVDDPLKWVIDLRVRVKASMTKSTPLAEERVQLPQAMESLLAGNAVSRRALIKMGVSARVSAVFARNPKPPMTEGGIVSRIL